MILFILLELDVSNTKTELKISMNHLISLEIDLMNNLLPVSFRLNEENYSRLLIFDN